MIRVVICDDQEVVRKGLRIILEHTEGMAVVGTAANGEEAVAQVAAHLPDVVLMDLKMPVLNGIHATRRLTAAYPQVRVLVLTTYDADEWVLDAMRAGASGYLLKDAEGEEIATAVRQAARGETPLDPAIAGRLVAAFRAANTAVASANAQTPLLDALTERENSVLALMAQGMNNRQIAETLFLAEGTVKNNVSQIIGKLQANDRTQAVVFALRQGLVSLG